MKKNFRVVQINGFRGLVMAFFILSCMIAGFVIFPAFVTMTVWNYLAVKTSSFTFINIAEGILLWAIITFSIYIFNKRKFIVSFNAQQELTEDEVSEVVSRIQAQTLKHQVILPKEFVEKEKKEELEVTSENKD
jgi:hypothetical protein